MAFYVKVFFTVAVAMLTFVFSNNSVFSNVEGAREIGKAHGFEVIEYSKMHFMNNADEFYQSALDCFDWKK